MGVQKFLKSALKSSMATFDAEEIGIGDTLLHAIIDESRMGSELGIGANKNERTLIVQFPYSSYMGKLKSGMMVYARGQKWQIHVEGESIKIGPIATTLTLVEPERRAE